MSSTSPTFWRRWTSRLTGARPQPPPPVPPDEPGPGQESVWDYPRPPRVERVRRRARIVHHGTLVVDTDDVVRVLETSHPPTVYLPRYEFGGLLRASTRTTYCEWKGEAHYVDIVVPGAPPLVDVGWWYPQPDLRYPQLTDRVAVYPGRFDEVTLGGEVVHPQPGEFYGGWVTAEIAGPFKGSEGTWGW